MTERVQIIDSHTEGEPTRVVIEGGPDLGCGSARERLERFSRDHDAFRSAVVNEPRGSEALVGALLLEPTSPAAAVQVIFFNNVGYLGMCVHGTMGVAATLAWLGRLVVGRHTFETPVGDVFVHVMPNQVVSVENVVSYKHQDRVTIETARGGPVTGDVAWGGNWFFLVDQHGLDLDLAHLDDLIAYTWDIRTTLARQGIRGRDGGEIDHVELFGPPTHPRAHSKNFVLCPGKAYDRSPCGTGTSAKMACLFEDGRLEAGTTWVQESILGTCFEGSVHPVPAGVLPTVSGRAFVTAEADLIFLEDDPFRWGIRP